MSEQSILQEAESIVNGERNESYGDAKGMFQRIADLWAPILEDCIFDEDSFPHLEIEPRHVALCMIQLKIARETYRSKRDNRVDMAGYAELLDQVSAPGEAIRTSEEMSQNIAEQERLRSEIEVRHAGTKDLTAEKHTVTSSDTTPASVFSSTHNLPNAGWWVPGDAFIYPSRELTKTATGGLEPVFVRVWPRETRTDRLFFDRRMIPGRAEVYRSRIGATLGGDQCVPVRLIVEAGGAAPDGSSTPESRL